MLSIGSSETFSWLLFVLHSVAAGVSQRGATNTHVDAGKTRKTPRMKAPPGPGNPTNNLPAVRIQVPPSCWRRRGLAVNSDNGIIAKNCKSHLCNYGGWTACQRERREQRPFSAAGAAQPRTAIWQKALLDEWIMSCAAEVSAGSPRESERGRERKSRGQKQIGGGA